MNTHTLSLNNNWTFHYGDIPDAWKKDFDDISWESVSLPHDWSVLIPAVPDMQPEGSDGIVQDFPFRKIFVANESSCSSMASIRKARSGLTATITDSIQMVIHRFYVI